MIWLLWWALRGSNSRHPPCKGGALPTELNALTLIIHTQKKIARKYFDFFKLIFQN